MEKDASNHERFFIALFLARAAYRFVRTRCIYALSLSFSLSSTSPMIHAAGGSVPRIHSSRFRSLARSLSHTRTRVYDICRGERASERATTAAQQCDLTPLSLSLSLSRSRYRTNKTRATNALIYYSGVMASFFSLYSADLLFFLFRVVRPCSAIAISRY